MAGRQEHQACGETSAGELTSELESRPLASLIGVVVEGQVDATTRPIDQLSPLHGCQMGADGAGSIAKTGLPQHCQVKQTFDQDHGGAVVECLPSKQAAFGAGQELVRESAADTAAIQVDDVTLLAAGEQDAAPEAVPALPADQPGLAQRLEGIAEGRQMAVQSPAGSVADTQFFNEVGSCSPRPCRYSTASA